MRVLIVDDHRLVVEGLTNLLAAHGFEVVATAADGEEAVAQTQRHRPDLVLMDIRMPRCDGLAATRLIKARMPEVRIVMLTTSAEDDDLFESIRSGACGYLLKSMGGDEFAASLAALERGVPPFSPGLAEKILREFARLSLGGGKAHAGETPGTGLTARQTEVLRAVASGLTYKEVGARLNLSERTVRYHMAEIMNALHLVHRSQVIAYAGRMGLKPDSN
jgi:two-component system NarL family response regulator